MKRSTFIAVILLLFYVIGLSSLRPFFLKETLGLATASVSQKNEKIVNNFQANFYFFYNAEFLPGIRKIFSEMPGLKELQIVSSAGVLLFDSSDLSVTPEKSKLTKKFSPSTQVTSFIEGLSVKVIAPSSQFSFVYTFESAAIKNIFYFCLALGFIVIGAFSFYMPRFLPNSFLTKLGQWLGRGLRHFSGLRAKLLLTIVLINVITGVIVFVTLSALQSEEESKRIKKESVLFSRFSTGQIISDFSNYYYFYYADRFLPGIKTIISSNENLVGLKIISRRNLNILFDSQEASNIAQPATSVKHADLPADIEMELRARDSLVREVGAGDTQLLSVINAFKSENQESLFYVEYLFSFKNLQNSVRAIRRQILIDLVPSMILGLCIAILFAQFLIGPIRRLAQALGRVKLGDFDISLESNRKDEIGDLFSAFNAMAGELRKKRELRKYLSDSTYRQIMEAAEKSGDAKLGGSRIAATILFCDIRNFVGHCENLEAEEVTAMLNDFFSEMVDVVYRYGGEVDKFIGDAMLAVFYADGSTAVASSTALQAIYCSLEMRERLKSYNAKRIAASKGAIEIGIGITHGEVISGPIGSKDRMDFTVIGDSVNLASRIEKVSKRGKHTKIVFSNHVEEKIRDLMEYEVLHEEPIAGKQEQVTVYELVRIRDLKTLIDNLKGSDLSLRQRSIEVLGRSNNQAAMPVLIKGLNETDEQLKLAAVSAISRLAVPNDQQAISNLLTLLKKERSEKVVASIISSLGKICIDKKILAIAPFLESKSERIIANAVEALGQVKSGECLDLILPKLASRNNRVKANAAMALFAAGKTEVIETLKPMLMHSDASMRSSAAFAIGELTLLAHKEKLLEMWQSKAGIVKSFMGELQECVPMLVSLLKDPNQSVKRQAIIALGKIKDKSAVLPILDNIDFDKDSRELLSDVVNALRAIGSHKLVRDVISRMS